MTAASHQHEPRASALVPDCSFGTLLETERGRLISQLDKCFGTLRLHELGPQVANIERWIEQELLRILWELGPFTLSCAKCKQFGCIRDTLGAVYEICIARDIPPSATLNIAVSPKNIEAKPKMRQHTVRIRGSGPCSRVRIFWPDYLSLDEEVVGQLIGTVLETAAGWTRHQVEAVSARSERDIGRVVYTLLRTIIPSAELRSNLWIATVTASYGFRFIDQQVTGAAFDVFLDHACLHGHSANRLVAELISTRLPCEGLLMNIARRLNQCLEGDIRKAQYRKDGLVYGDVMEALYGREAFMMYPLLVESEFGVFALFPSEARSELEVRLSKHKEQLVKAIRKHLGEIKQCERLFDKVRQPRFHLGKLLEFFMLKPNVFGMGVNVNRLCSALLNRPPNKTNADED